MARSHVTETELRLLQVLWDTSPLTIRAVCEQVYGKTDETSYATVKSLLERLERKGWVERDRSAFRHTFRPLRPRGAFIEAQLQTVADQVCGGSIAALLGHIAQADALTDADRERLRALIDGRDPDDGTRG